MSASEIETELVKKILGVVPTQTTAELVAAVGALEAVLRHVRAVAHDRQRMYDEETKQLAFLVGTGPKQRRTDRRVDDEAIIRFLIRIGAAGAPLQDIARETTIGAGALNALRRLQTERRVVCRGRGKGARWFIQVGVEPSEDAPIDPPTPTSTS